ncbi:MAG: MerR family transcriptional regulator [Desulfobacterales bacterium]|nr:MerR family transcriptional regulator [Desulfobacterales bacterium]
MATAAVSARPDSVQIPNKLYFRIGDVSKLASVEPYVLRFWENEFPCSIPRRVAPTSASTAARMSRSSLKSSTCCMEKRFTIEGAPFRPETAAQPFGAQATAQGPAPPDRPVPRSLARTEARSDPPRTARAPRTPLPLAFPEHRDRFDLHQQVRTAEDCLDARGRRQRV